MHFYKKIKKKSLHKTIINILNGTLELTEREKQVLYVLMQLDISWSPTFRDDYKDVLSTDSRRAIMKETNVHKANLVKYVNKFKNKGLLVQNEQGGWEVNSAVTTPPVGGVMEIAYTIEIEDYNAENTTKTVV
jgi:hypothetical protein